MQNITNKNEHYCLPITNIDDDSFIWYYFVARYKGTPSCTNKIIFFVMRYHIFITSGAKHFVHLIHQLN